MIQILKSILSRLLILVAGFLIISSTNLSAQNVVQIVILNADIMGPDKRLGPGIQKLLGNVKFKHEEAVMTCDSAYFYSKSYSMDAFSNVAINQGDTLFLYGDKVHYEGETRIAQIRDNVKLIDDSTVLITEYLDYNRETKIAYYLDGGVINEGENELISEQGYYYTETEVFNFKDSVVVINPDYTIYSDTLEYNTKTNIAYFFGPTEIIGEENYLYCEGGWYDTDLDISLLNTNAYLKNEGGRTLYADTLYYEREVGYGNARSNVEMFDSAQNVTMKGNSGIYYEKSQLATLTDSALMILVNGPDTLFVHADTLRSIIDTASIDEKKILLAYDKVKLFREDLQGMCDSMVYFEKDSVFHLFGEPIIWSDENQITATKIEIKIKDETLNRIFLRDIALLISQEDSIMYNQIRGKGMIGYFKNNNLVRLDVTGNGQTLYYTEDQGNIIGVDKTECSDLIIYLKDNQVRKVNYLVQPTGKFYPLNLFPENQRYLDGFSWNDQWRPLKFTDVFIWK
jgi:lipopolysaccharide export system protein LptA